MSYRGPDLDLRVSGARGLSRSGPLAGADAGHGLRPDPLWVDDIVLACCNHAYDLAVAHRAAEVRLEHLLNAMTRIDAAARVLEARGLRIADIRRDTANSIVGELPVPALAGRFTPKTSTAVEEILRLAARQAANRHSPATTTDVLTVLIDMKRDLPGFDPLRTGYDSWNLREPVDPRYAMPEEPREWMRGGAPGYYVSPPPRPEPYSPGTDSVQNARLDGLERALRDIAHSLNTERAAYPHYVAEQRRRDEPMPTPRAEPTHLTTLVLDRMAGVERNVDIKFAELARTWSVLGERLHAMEQTMTKQRVDVGGIPAGLTERLRGIETFDSKLAEIDRTINVMADRMVALERHLSTREHGSAADIQPVLDRLTLLDRSLSNKAGGNVDLGPLVDLIAGLERTITSQPKAAVDLSQVVERLNGLERAIAARPSVQTADLGPLGEQLGQRLRVIEEAVTAQRSGFAHFAASVGGEVRQLTTSLKQSPATADGVKTYLSEHMQAINALVERQPTQIAGGVAQPLLQRMSALSTQIESRQADSDRAFGAIAERLSVLERSLGSWGQQAAEIGVTHERDVKEVHDALVRLNANQQTLANSMDQWRLDLTGDLGEVANRISALEVQSQKPLQVLDRMATSMQTIQAGAFKRDEQKSRFRHWLMGTDDWYGASWEGNGNGSAKPAGGTDPRTQDRGIRPPTAPTGRRDA